jgi:hypothetical protein
MPTPVTVLAGLYSMMSLLNSRRNNGRGTRECQVVK